MEKYIKQNLVKYTLCHKMQLDNLKSKRSRNSD